MISTFTKEGGLWNANKTGTFTVRRNAIFRRIEGVERTRRRRDSQYLVQLEKYLWQQYNKLLAQDELDWF